MVRTSSHTSTRSVHAGKKHLPALFADRAEQYPSNIAVRFDDLTLTYENLNNTANQFAHFLLANNINVEDKIGLALDRCPEMIITLLAILKAGAAYLPLDPEYPSDRIEYMLADSSVEVLITQKKYAGQFSSTAKQLFIEDIWPALNSFDIQEPEIEIKGENLAYILYTSGSTGRPKGVPIEHHNLTNLLVSMQKTPGITDTDILLSVTTISFDIAALELFLPLISGATLVIANTETSKDARILLKIAKTHSITIMQATPNTWRMMLESGWDERLPIKALCGGEALPKSLVDKLLTKCDSLWNMYGPTETTIWSTVKQISALDDVITIGKPIDNTTVYILNESNKPVINGETGEICIGGDGLARGYLNRPELTSDKFINCNVANNETVLLYKTGDLGKILTNGEIQCFGRIDHQVKLNGFRIELEEIESVIQKSGLVTDVVVLTRENENDTRSLVGYAIPNLDKVLLKEKELYKKQTDNWEKVYDVEYQNSETSLQSDASTFNTNIWTDSFTIKIIPVEQMQEWLTDIITTILSEKPQNVLEIGCGTGLIYYQLAPHIKKYIGTDLSASGINSLTKEVNKEGNSFPETSLMVCGAHDINLPKNEDVDTIVINSVIQYFPGEGYLSDVLAKSIELLNGSGKIILGDVRDLRLLKLFKSYVHLSKLSTVTDKKEFTYHVDQEVFKEEELCVSPEYFYDLKLKFPEITHVSVQWKQGEYVNELIAYRYNVIIYVGINKDTIKPNWVKWDDVSDIGSAKQDIENRTETLAFSDLPNPRLAKEALLQSGLDNRSINNTQQLSAFISTDDHSYTEADKLIKLAQSNGYTCSFMVNQDPLKINLLLQLQSKNCFIESSYASSPRNVKAFLTNIPLLSTICTSIQRDIYKEMQQKLPNYMIPANLMIVSHLPLTNNGKIDRQFLIQRNNLNKVALVNYQPPRNAIEKKLVAIWQEFLGIEKIGIDANFFELGGNSLIAIRIMITLEKEAGKDLPLSLLFEYPTIEKLAAVIQHTPTLNTSKCLVPLKPEGSRIPLYLIHGWGLTVFIFNDIAKKLHPDQPVFALQGIGVDGSEEPLTTVEDIAARYIAEILEQNPTGPYAFGGYSLGGVISCEIAKQLRVMGKKVIMMAMLDAYAHSTVKNLNQSLMGLSFKKVNRFFLRISHNLIQLIKDPNTWNEKMIQVQRKLPKWLKRSTIVKLRKDNDVDFYSNDLSKVYFNAAVQNYKLTNYEDTIDLFRATKNIYYYMDDPNYLGWQQYAKTVNFHKVKGTHTTMLQPPNDTHFAEVLQQCLDNANKLFEEETIANEAAL